MNVPLRAVRIPSELEPKKAMSRIQYNYIDDEYLVRLSDHSINHKTSFGLIQPTRLIYMGLLLVITKILNFALIAAYIGFDFNVSC